MFSQSSVGTGQWLDGDVMIDELIIFQEALVTQFTTAGTTGLYPTMVTGAMLLYVVTGGGAEMNPILSTRLYFEDA